MTEWPGSSPRMRSKPPCRSVGRSVAQMEVGIEDCLHIEFEYDKARYHLQDVVVGRIHFLLVSLS